MGMVAPQIWPESNPSKAYDLAVRTLKADPVLQASVITWQLWEGLDEREDTRPIVWDDLPAVRITPTLGQSEWQDNVSHRVPLILTVEMYVAGTRAVHLFDLWGAIIDALFPGVSYGTLNDSFVTEAACFARTATGPVPTVQTWDAGQLGIKGQAAVRLEVRVDT